MKLYDNIIIGGGIAAYTSGIYLARSGLDFALYEGEIYGGQLTNTSEVDNFPGYPNGTTGFDLIEDVRNQNINLKTNIISDNIDKIEIVTEKNINMGSLEENSELRSEVVKYLENSAIPYIFELEANNQKVYTKTIILAMGAEYRKLGIPGEEEFANKGVSYCAVCDGSFFKDKHVVVVGGGDSAFEEALYLSKLVNKVHLIYYKDKKELKAKPHLQSEVAKTENIFFLDNTKVNEIKGDNSVNEIILQELRLDHIDDVFLDHHHYQYENNQTLLNPDVLEGNKYSMQVDGVFIAIGHKPNSDLIINSSFGKILNYTQGYVDSNNFIFTTIKGLFVAGDISDYNYRQAVTASAFGCMSAIEVIKLLNENNNIDNIKNPDENQIILTSDINIEKFNHEIILKTNRV